MASALRLFTSRLHSRSFSWNKKFCLPIYQPNFKSQAASLHKCLIFNNKNALEQEIEESDSDLELNNETTDNFSSLKLKILNAGLNFVPDYGWTNNSIACGAKSLGLSSASHSLIQDGGADLVHYFNYLCNEKLDSYLKQQTLESTDKKNIQEYIKNALEYRLRMVIPFVTQWPQAMALMVSPTQLSTDFKNFFDLVDIIWNNSGSELFNATWYSKRIVLAMTYKLCELSLVQDKSPEFSDSFAFMQKRVDMNMNNDQFLNQIIETSQQLPNYGIGALITMRNIFGVNNWFR